MKLHLILKYTYLIKCAKLFLRVRGQLLTLTDFHVNLQTYGNTDNVVLRNSWTVKYMTFTFDRYS